MDLAPQAQALPLASHDGQRPDLALVPCANGQL